MHVRQIVDREFFGWLWYYVKSRADTTGSTQVFVRGGHGNAPGVSGPPPFLISHISQIDGKQCVTKLVSSIGQRRDIRTAKRVKIASAGGFDSAPRFIRPGWLIVRHGNQLYAQIDSHARCGRHSARCRDGVRVANAGSVCRRWRRGRRAPVARAGKGAQAGSAAGNRTGGAAAGRPRQCFAISARFPAAPRSQHRGSGTADTRGAARTAPPDLRGGA